MKATCRSFITTRLPRSSTPSSSRKLTLLWQSYLKLWSIFNVKNASQATSSITSRGNLDISDGAMGVVIGVYTGAFQVLSHLVGNYGNVSRGTPSLPNYQGILNAQVEKDEIGKQGLEEENQMSRSPNSWEGRLGSVLPLRPLYPLNYVDLIEHRF